jgi:dTDP-4-dehydrorhamnose reductase
MTILVLGASGQLASHLRELLPDALYWGKTTFDLRNPTGLLPAITALAPSFIVNSAAYTAVDRAEIERDAAWSVNAEAAAMAARSAARLDVPLLHISTDYVFDGTKAGAYAVDDACRPLSVYGQSKLGGELAVESLAPRHWILRTSWLFSEHGSNFVKTIVRLARDREELRVVADQLGTPTYAGDLARLVARIAEATDAVARLPYGIHHAVGGPRVSWHGFAQAIVDAAARQKRLTRAPRVTPISTDSYPTPARRPANSVLLPSAVLGSAFDVVFDWPSGLEKTIEQMN